MPEIRFDSDFLRRLEQLHLVSRRVFRGSGRGERRSRRRGLSVEFVDYRNYVPGDDLRYLDWNLYGRLDRLFLKLFEEEEELHLTLLVDTSRSMHFGEPPKLEHALKLAAAIAYIGLAGLDRVSFASFSGELEHIERGASGRHRAPRLFRSLERISADGPTALGPAVRRLVAEVRRPGLLVLVSDFLDPAGYAAPLRQLVGRGFDVAAVHVLAPEEVDPPLVGDLRLIDSETGEARELSMGMATLKRYRDTVSRFGAELAAFCKARGIHYTQALATAPFERACLDALRKIGLLR